MSEVPLYGKPAILRPPPLSSTFWPASMYQGCRGASLRKKRPPLGPYRKPTSRSCGRLRGREFFIDYLLVRNHFIILTIAWTGLVPLKLEFPFSGSLTSTFRDRPTFLKVGGLKGLDLFCTTTRPKNFVFDPPTLAIHSYRRF